MLFLCEQQQSSGKVTKRKKKNKTITTKNVDHFWYWDQQHFFFFCCFSFAFLDSFYLIFPSYFFFFLSLDFKGFTPRRCFSISSCTGYIKIEFQFNNFLVFLIEIEKKNMVRYKQQKNNCLRKPGKSKRKIFKYSCKSLYKI